MGGLGGALALAGVTCGSWIGTQPEMWGVG